MGRGCQGKCVYTTVQDSNLGHIMYTISPCQVQDSMRLNETRQQQGLDKLSFSLCSLQLRKPLAARSLRGPLRIALLVGSSSGGRRCCGHLRERYARLIGRKTRYAYVMIALYPGVSCSRSRYSQLH